MSAALRRAVPFSSFLASSQQQVDDTWRPGAHSRLTWSDWAWLALVAATVPTERLAAMRLIVTPGTILRW
jgi:hypothetical protein